MQELEEKVLSAEEVAERLGLSVHQVYRRLKRGDLPSHMGGLRGQQYLVNAGELQQYIDAGQPLSMPKRPTDMLRVNEVAQMTGFTEETVRKLCREGSLRHVRGSGRNGHLRIHRSSLELYLSQNKPA